MHTYIHQLFSKVIFETKLNFSKKELNKFISDFKKFSLKNISESNNTTKATNNKHLLKNKKFKLLKDNLLKEFNSFKNSVLKYEKCNFDITTSWLAVSNSGNEGIYHNHQNSFYSGVYYLKTPENGGNIKFRDYSNKNFYIPPSIENCYNSVEWGFKVKENLLLFFPSESYHVISKNNSKKDRVSLAFNIMPTGKFGCNDSEVILKVL